MISIGNYAMLALLDMSAMALVPLVWSTVRQSTWADRDFAEQFETGAANCRPRYCPVLMYQYPRGLRWSFVAAIVFIDV